MQQQYSNQNYGDLNANWQKTSISDQTLERMQESANKRSRIAKEQERQRLREQPGYQSPSEDER